jgi:glycosyltransferase involved in cell wall biosynthesis
MRIGVNARSLAYGCGGPTEYLRGLVTALLARETGHELVLFYPDASHVGTFPQATEVALACRNRLAFDWLALPRALRRRSCDVAFFPSSNMPPGIPCPAVVAMLDLGYFHPTLRMYKAADTLYMRFAIRYAAARAESVLAISEYTRRDVLRLTRARPEAVSLTHLACDPIYKRPADPEATVTFRRRHGLTRDYILYTGNISPRKNLPTLLAAFAAARDRLPCDLAVTGGLAWNEDFTARVASLGLDDRVRRLGQVAREDMPTLYDGALALAFPSLFEGFGLPVLEAQARGLPVVCAEATSLPEVAGDGALLVAPLDVSAWAEALVAVSTDPALRDRLIRLGTANEARFTWRRTAEATLAALEAVAR